MSNKKEMTPGEFLRWIEKQLFKNGELKSIPTLDAASQHKLMLEQTDQLLASDQYGYEATWLGDQFWTADRDLYLIVKSHPLLSDANRMYSQEDSELTVDDYARAQWLTKTALLCHQLYTHADFDTDMLQEGLHLKATKGAPNQGLLGNPCADDLAYANQKLIDWIRTTPYRRIAAMVAATIVDRELDRAITTNQAVQDYYAYNCTKHSLYLSSLDDCNEHIEKWLGAMEEMRQHHEKGVALGLTDEEIRVADALWEFVPHYYNDDLVRCAREFCKQAEQLLPDKPYIKSENGARMYQRKALPKLHKIADQWEISFDENDVTSLSASYTASWLYDKYYAE